MRIVQNIGAARRATVRVCDVQNIAKGQGLRFDLPEVGTYILTCHHVLVTLPRDGIYVSLPDSTGALANPPTLIRATYEDGLSDAAGDTAVLRIEAPAVVEQVLMHEVHPEAYNGRLPVTCISHLKPDTFDATLTSAAHHLDYSVPTRALGWKDAPASYQPTIAFRMTGPTDAVPGISGSAVFCQGGILGLVSAARSEDPTHERQDFMIPLRAWTGRLSQLSSLIQPLVDEALFGVAIVKHAGDLTIGDLTIGDGADDPDFVVHGYLPDVYIEREIEQKARDALANRGIVMLVGKPLSGKTRLAYHLLREWPNALVVMPQGYQVLPERFEAAGFWGYDIIVVFENLVRQVPACDPYEWRRRLMIASDRSVRLLCTSRDGSDWRNVQSQLQARWERFSDRMSRQGIIYTSQVGDAGADLSREEAWKLFTLLHDSVTERQFDAQFDGTVGSLVLSSNLESMRQRYDDLAHETKNHVRGSQLLDAAKLLHVAEQPHLNEELLRKVAGKLVGTRRLSPHEWDWLRQRTAEEGFGKFSTSGEFQTYGAYLEQCVTFAPSQRDLEDLATLLQERRDVTGLLFLARAERK